MARRHNDPDRAADIEQRHADLNDIAKEVAAVEFHDDNRGEKFIKIRLHQKRNRSLIMTLGAKLAHLLEAPFLRLGQREAHDPGEAPQSAYRSPPADRFFKGDVTYARRPKLPDLNPYDAAQLQKLARGIDLRTTHGRTTFRARVNEWAEAGASNKLEVHAWRRRAENYLSHLDNVASGTRQRR